MVLTVIALGFTIVILWTIFGIIDRIRRQRFYKQAKRFGGPRPLPIVGNAHLFTGDAETVMRKLMELMNQYPSPFRVWFGQHLYVVLTTPEQLKTICLSPKTIERGELMDFVRPWWGSGLLTAPAVRWKAHRKLIKPTFNQKVLNDFVQIFAAQSKLLTEQLAKNLYGPEFAIIDFLKPCTLDIICETAMGVKVGAQTDGDCQYLAVVHKVVNLIGRRMFSPWLYPDFIFNNVKAGRDQRKYVKYLHDFTKNVIETKKKTILERGDHRGVTDSDSDECNSMRPKQAFLDHLLKPSADGTQKFSDEDLREEVDTLLIAGCDSNAYTNSFAMLMLASHPDIQEKAYQELYEIYGKVDVREREVRHEDLSRMNYLERVIKETLRLFPFAPVIIRKVQEDLTVEEGLTLPKGSTAVMGVMEVHRSEKYWSNPLKFNPDQFLPEEVAKRHPYTYLPFSAGPRNCIGLQYAMMAMKTLLATVLRTYILKKDDVISVKDLRLNLDITLKPTLPIKLRIEERPKN